MYLSLVASDHRTKGESEEDDGNAGQSQATHSNHSSASLSDSNNNNHQNNNNHSQQIDLSNARSLRSLDRSEFGALIANGFDSNGNPNGSLNGVVTNQIATSKMLEKEGIATNPPTFFENAMNYYHKKHNLKKGDAKSNLFQVFLASLGMTFDHLNQGMKKSLFWFCLFFLTLFLYGICLL